MPRSMNCCASDRAMDDGGLVAIVAPANPSRCPPGPYERASMIAYYLKNNKPRSKLVILDAKDTFTMQPLFMNAWKELYPGIIEWKSPSSGGNAASIDVTKKTIETDFDTYQYRRRQCDPAAESRNDRGARGRGRSHRLVSGRPGDVRVTATEEHPRHRRRRARRRHAEIGFLRVNRRQTVRSRGCTPAHWRNTDGGKTQSNCYSVVAPNYAISISGLFEPVNGEYAEVDNSISSSPLDAPPASRVEEAKKADAWFKENTAEIFG